MCHGTRLRECSRSSPRQVWSVKSNEVCSCAVRYSLRGAELGNYRHSNSQRLELPAADSGLPLALCARCSVAASTVSAFDALQYRSFPTTAIIGIDVALAGRLWRFDKAQRTAGKREPNALVVASICALQVRVCEYRVRRGRRGRCITM